MKVAIFGGAGRIGSNLAKYLLENTDASVVSIDNLASGSLGAGSFGYLHSNPKFEFYLGDVSDIYFVELVIADANYIVNCIDCKDNDEMINTLIIGTHNILECLCPEQKYIHVGEYACEPVYDMYEMCHNAANNMVHVYNTERKYRSQIVFRYEEEFINRSVANIILGKQ